MEEPWRPAPGKRSRTAGLRGRQSELASFPHRAAIERAFAQTVPDRARLGAADDCAAIGAEAFAVGDEVAFASREPALHTAAHEAAHVLQERIGAGGATDLEAHAERAAALVVLGRSAAHMFGGEAPARELRRRPEGTPAPNTEPAAGALPQAPVMQYTLFKKKVLTSGITVSGNLVIGGSPGRTGRVEVSAGPGAEWSLDRLRQPAGKKRREGLGARLRDSINTKLEAPAFAQRFELEGLPDLKVELTTKLEAEGLQPGAVMEAEVSGDVTELAVEQGWIPPATPLRLSLQLEVAVRVEADDLARLALLRSARKQVSGAADVIGRSDEILRDLEKRRAELAVRRESISKNADPRLWDELDAKHRAVQEEIGRVKGVRGAARKRFSAAIKRFDDVSRRVKGALAKGLARAVGKTLARQVLKLMPIVGWVSWAADAWELWKLLTEDHAAGDSSEGEKGPASGGQVGEEKASGAGDGEAGGTGGDTEGADRGEETADGRSDGREAGNHGGDESGSPGADPKKLHVAARRVYDVVTVRGGGEAVAIDEIWIEALGNLVPQDLPADKLDALCRTLERGSSGRAGDPDLILEAVARAIQSVLRQTAASESHPRHSRPAGSDGHRWRREPLAEVMTELSPRELVEWKDGELRQTEAVARQRGLPFRLPDGTMAEIVDLTIVEEERRPGSDIVPFRIVIQLRKADGSVITVIQQHAIEPGVGADGRATFFKKGEDEIRGQLRALIDHQPSGKVKLKEGMSGKTIEVAGATLRPTKAELMPSREGSSSVAIPGLTISQVVVHMDVAKVRGAPAIVDDFGRVHHLREGETLKFEMILESVFTD